MNLKTFFEHFDTLAEAPNGIQRLRELILDMAVRGKLVPQDPEDEPAISLFKKIISTREILEKQKLLSKSKPLEKVQEEDFPFDLPKGWQFQRFGHIVSITRGITFPANAKFSTNGEGLIPCLRTANIQKEIDWDDLIYVPKSYVKRGDQYIEDMDIVMSMANSRELVGKVAINRKGKQFCSFGGFLSVIRTIL